MADRAATTKKVSGSPARSRAKANGKAGAPTVDWKRVARTLLISRELDRIEEEELVPAGLITYQFSSRGHDLAQILLGQFITNRNDAATVYYRSRPFVLTQGLTPAEALMSTMGRAGGISEGRDIGVVHNLPRREFGTVLPTSGDVGAQFTPAIGWAQAAKYRAAVLKDESWGKAIGLAMAGDAACATNGFWSALTIATTQSLPYLFFIEDNGYGISVTGELQTPGGDISANLASFKDLKIIKGDGTEPEETAALIAEAVTATRDGKGPVLLHLTVPRLSGHSFADNQSYKSPELVAEEESRDPLPKLRSYLKEKKILDDAEWTGLQEEAIALVAEAAEKAKASPTPDTSGVRDHAFHQEGVAKQEGTEEAKPEGPRMNLIDAVRRTLGSELEANDRVLIFGEDVGLKGGVHGATVDLQRLHGGERVFDTSLNEEGIIGRAVGMAMAGLMPVPEIQFRKYADPAHEQITDAGTIRWRTAGKFAAPMVVRMPVGYGKKTGDPWHSVSGEALYAHLVGWRIAIPSNAEDAVGLLRSALRGNDPTMFFEHRALLDTREGRRPWPGDEFILPFGKGRIVRKGKAMTIVSWGALLHRAEEAAEKSGVDVEVIDLRTVAPWDRGLVLESVAKTGRVLIVHEDNSTAGFGAEIAAVIAQDAFRHLDAPIERLTTPDIPVPYNTTLMDAVVPTVGAIAERIERLMKF